MGGLYRLSFGLSGSNLGSVQGLGAFRLGFRAVFLGRPNHEKQKGSWTFRAPEKHISKNKDRDIPYKPLIMNPNKVGDLHRKLIFVCFWGP